MKFHGFMNIIEYHNVILHTSLCIICEVIFRFWNVQDVFDSMEEEVVQCEKNKPKRKNKMF